MKTKISFVFPQGTPTPTASAVGAMALADWFGSDIQRSERSLDEWMKRISDVASGRRHAGYQGTGNTSSVTAAGNWILIENEHLAEQKVLLTSEQAIAALENYRRFLRSNSGAQAALEPFSIEYEAEGAAARDRYLDLGKLPP